MYGSQLGDAPLDPSVLRLILPAMIGGVVLFACVVLVVSPDSGSGANSNDQKTPILTYIAGGFLATSVVAALAAPALIVGAARRALGSDPRTKDDRPDAESADERRAWLARTLFMKILVGSAILEGAALFLIVACMVEGQRLPLMLAAIPVAGIAIQVPTRHRIEQWIDREIRVADQAQA